MTPQEVVIGLCERLTMLNGVDKLDVTWVVASEKGTATLQVNVYGDSGNLQDIYTLSMELEKEN